jgi:hypothetical protein
MEQHDQMHGKDDSQGEGKKGQDDQPAPNKPQ